MRGAGTTRWRDERTMPRLIFSGACPSARCAAAPRTTRTILAIAVVFMVCALQRASASTEERVALKAFYRATGGEHWTDSSTNGWLGRCYCQWVGVDCCNNPDPRGCGCEGQVINIVRETDKNLTGVLPSWNGDPGQGALPHLGLLALSQNPGLTGTLPEVYGEMVEMTSLQLYANNHTGTLPESYGKMTKMTSMPLYVEETNNPAARHSPFPSIATENVFRF